MVKTWLQTHVTSLPETQQKAKIYIFTKEYYKNNCNAQWRINNFNLITGLEILTCKITHYWKQVVRLESRNALQPLVLELYCNCAVMCYSYPYLGILCRRIKLWLLVENICPFLAIVFMFYCLFTVQDSVWLHCITMRRLTEDKPPHHQEIFFSNWAFQSPGRESADPNKWRQRRHSVSFTIFIFNLPNKNKHGNTGITQKVENKHLQSEFF